MIADFLVFDHVDHLTESRPPMSSHEMNMQDADELNMDVDIAIESMFKDQTGLMSNKSQIFFPNQI